MLDRVSEFDQCGIQQDRWVKQKKEESDQVNPEENMTGDILHQVYIATKLNKIGTRFRKMVISIYDVEEAKAIDQQSVGAGHTVKVGQVFLAHNNRGGGLGTVR